MPGECQTNWGYHFVNYVSKHYALYLKLIQTNTEKKKKVKPEHTHRRERGIKVQKKMFKITFKNFSRILKDNKLQI